MKKLRLYLIIIIIACIGVYTLLSVNTSINDFSIDKTKLEVQDSLTVNNDKNVENSFLIQTNQIEIP